MSGQATGGRFTVPVDVHLILLRNSPKGQQVLLTRRSGPVYAAGLWHLPSGHLDGAHEDVVDGGLRELREETGVVAGRTDVRGALTVHHRAPAGGARTGVFLVVVDWQGEPEITEPDRCDAMDWFGWDALPEPMVAYCRAGLDTYRAGARLAVHFQQPGDPIAYDPALDRLRIVADAPLPANALVPQEVVRVFAEQAVGRITDWADASWARENSRVWRATGRSGGTWYVKIHQRDRFHGREVTAYRSWTHALGWHAPRLVAADASLRAIVVTALPGRGLHGAVLTPAAEVRVHHGLGELAAAFHNSAPPHTPPADRTSPAGKLERHLSVARPYLNDGDEELLRALASRHAALPPIVEVPTLGDLQLRNVLLADDGTLGLFDFERAEYAPAVRDLVRLSDQWHGRPDLEEAFLNGYGRTLTADEVELWECETGLDALSGIQFGMTHHDPELVERGHRTLARLHQLARS